MHNQTRRTSPSWKRVSLALLSASTLVRGQSAAYIHKRQEGEPEPEPEPFDWDSIEPSTELNWVRCYQTPLRCARLSVPLNYSNPEEGSGIVPIIKYPSPKADSPSYGGPILMNPGGPGVSGVAALVKSGSFMQILLGEEFDIVSFDTRGVGLASPNLTYPGTEEEEAQWTKGYEYLVDPGEESWDTLPERLETIEEFAILNEEERGDVLKHVTSDNVARDMLAIVEAHGFEKLRYWGISYGTALGHVFASMFPDKVERMIMDAVLDVEGYYKNDWSINISDADKTLEWFFKSCAEAGPELCAFHEDHPEAIRERYHAIEELVNNGTFTFPDESPFGTTFFHQIVHNQLYAPSTFPTLGVILASLEEGDIEPAAAVVQELGASIYPTITMRCADTYPVNDTVEEFQDYSSKMREKSRYMYDAVGGVRLSCARWKVNPDNFKGPMGGETSSPILFVGNTADPATPLLSAQMASEKFPGSRVLTYDIPGHGYMALPGNECIDEHFRKYMLDGSLPEEGTVCEDKRNFFTIGEPGDDGGDDEGSSRANVPGLLFSVVAIFPIISLALEMIQS